MSCEYPCHICDPEAWEEEMNRPPTWEEIEDDIACAWDAQSKLLDSLEALAYGKKDVRPGVPLWWGLIGDYPDEIEVREDREVEDFWPYGSRLLLNSQTYLCVEGYPDAYVRSYYIKPGATPHLAAVLAPQPPEWGMWMPSLEEF